MSGTTPRRSFLRPRAQQNTASSPNLRVTARSLAPTTHYPPNVALSRQASLSSLTQNSLATIPDASESYALSTVLDNDIPPVPQMPPMPGDVHVGDLVDVPGNMHGTVKFVGQVEGKKGVFAGVELSEEFALRGKNNGDVDGVNYFTTTRPGAGIFLPVNRATRRVSHNFPPTPTTPSVQPNFRATAGIGSNGYTPPTPALSKLSKSVGPATRAPSPQRPSPQHKKRGPSLPRPESPVRRPQTGTPSAVRPAIGGLKNSTRYGASPTNTKFSQSVRGTRDAGDPAKKKPTQTPKRAAMGPRSASVLGNGVVNSSDNETTPIGMARTTDSLGSVSSITARSQSPTKSYANDEELEKLRAQLEDRDRQLREQASSLAEMESALAEVQSLMNGSDSGSRNTRGHSEDMDVVQLKAQLREKNEKIAMLTAEFDAHRADFRSTIDTLELASTETERVYEAKLQEMAQEAAELREKNEDVNSVAMQLKQLEELVQELEEGLEDARRGEAEARGEVEFLRGEVERGRSELRREREKAQAIHENRPLSGDMAKEIEQRDDEIRGLKAIIHSLSRDAVPESNDTERTPTRHSTGLTRTERERLEREVDELRAVIDAKASREEELEKQLGRVQGALPAHPSNSQRISQMTTASNGTVKQDRSSRSTVVSWRERDLPQAPNHRRKNTLETMQESDAYSSATDNSTLWCEICETGGHDILTCTNMFGHQAGQKNDEEEHTEKEAVVKGLGPLVVQDELYRPAPLEPRKTSSPTKVQILPNPMDQGPVAGKESGVVDANKWCALCERDGHESVDCPFEDAF